MATVVADMTMSLDGFIADPSDGVEHLFGWYNNGPVAVTMPGAPEMPVRMSEASAAHFRTTLDTAGAIISGRRLFDHTQGWGGRHPVDVPVFVVTHTVPDGWPRPDAPFTFVTEGVESAVAQASAAAGDGFVGVAGADIAQQCLNAGLLDEVRVNVVPVLMGAGIRFFDNLTTVPITFDEPRVVEGTGVTHLSYRVRDEHRNR